MIGLELRITGSLGLLTDLYVRDLAYDYVSDDEVLLRDGILTTDLLRLCDADCRLLGVRADCDSERRAC